MTVYRGPGGSRGARLSRASPQAVRNRAVCSRRCPVLVDEEMQVSCATRRQPSVVVNAWSVLDQRPQESLYRPLAFWAGKQRLRTQSRFPSTRRGSPRPRQAAWRRPAILHSPFRMLAGVSTTGTGARRAGWVTDWLTAVLPEPTEESGGEQADPDPCLGRSVSRAGDLSSRCRFVHDAPAAGLPPALSILEGDDGSLRAGDGPVPGAAPVPGSCSGAVQSRVG